MDTSFLHWNDLPIIICIAMGALVPEFIRGFEERKTLTRLGILSFFCVLSSIFAYILQHADPGAAFTRAFLIGVSTRVTLLMNQSAQAQIPLLKSVLTELRQHNGTHQDKEGNT
jgi:hypothetical protein